MKRKHNILKLYKYPTARSSVRNNKATAEWLESKQQHPEEENEEENQTFTDCV
jgi:hypothetical protein